MPFTLVKRSWYPFLFVALAILAGAGVLLIAPPGKLFELLVGTTGLVAGFVYFLYSQHLQETRIFADLFRQFNERYDKLNDRLNLIVAREVQGLLSQEDKQTLFDYFNLCGEALESAASPVLYQLSQ